MTYEQLAWVIWVNLAAGWALELRMGHRPPLFWAWFWFLINAAVFAFLAFILMTCVALYIPLTDFPYVMAAMSLLGIVTGARSIDTATAERQKGQTS